MLTGCAGQKGQVHSSEAGGRAPAPRGAASQHQHCQLGSASVLFPEPPKKPSVGALCLPPRLLELNKISAPR